MSRVMLINDQAWHWSNECKPTAEDGDSSGMVVALTEYNDPVFNVLVQEPAFLYWSVLHDPTIVCRWARIRDVLCFPQDAVLPSRPKLDVPT